LWLALAVGVVWYWILQSNIVPGDVDLRDLVFPLVALALVFIVLFFLGDWRRVEGAERRAHANLAVALAGTASLAGSLVLVGASLLLVPFVGNEFAAGPNPFAMLAALIGGFINSWVWAVVAARHAQRGPTVGHVAGLLLIAAAPHVALAIEHRRENAEFDRQRLAGNGCGAYRYGDTRSPMERHECFDLAERTRQSGVDGLARAVDVYAWGCREVREPASCVALAGLYERGEGVGRNWRRAHDLYAVGCGVLDPQSCIELARLVYDGRGTKPDPDRALLMWDTWCRRGHADACAHLERVHQSHQP
jgi:hypothetical protein